MKIAYSCNDYYIPQTGISMISLCENNKDADDIVFYFIGKDVSHQNVLVLKQIVEKYNRKFVFVDFDTIAYDLNISAIGRHIETIYTKVFFSRIEGLEKIIYLDSDTIVNGSLKGLWELNLENYYMGAVESYTGPKHKLGMSPCTPFFNDGMAIVNVDYCRKNKLIEKTLRVIEEYHGNPPVLSEGALNKVCQEKVLFISPRWNMMSGLFFYGILSPLYLAGKLTQYSVSEISSSCSSPIIIHYLTGFYNRPWYSPCTHPLKHLYYKYQRMSMWNDLEPTHNALPVRLRFISFCMKYKVLIFKYISKVWMRY